MNNGLQRYKGFRIRRTDGTLVATVTHPWTLYEFARFEGSLIVFDNPIRIIPSIIAGYGRTTYGSTFGS